MGMVAVQRTPRKTLYVDTEISISYNVDMTLNISSFDFFPQPFKNVKAVLSPQAHTNISNGLDLGGGLWYADACYREIIESTLTTWVQN